MGAKVQMLIVCIAVCLALPSLCEVTARDVTAVVQAGVRNAEPLLARARQELSRTRQLASVTALVIEGERIRDPVRGAERDSFKYRILLPARFQSVQRERYLHTIDGATFWQDPEPPDPAMGPSIEKNVRSAFGRTCLEFLLRLPPTIAAEIRGVGPVQFGSISGEGVEVAGPFNMTIVFDPASHRPVAFVSKVRRIAPNAPDALVTNIRRPDDYREVDGVLFPFRFDETTGTSQSLTVVQKVVVDTRMTAASFRKKAGL